MAPRSNTHSNDTPHVARVGGTNSASHRAEANAKSISSFRRTVATELREAHLVEGGGGSVVELCTPTGSDARTKAREVAEAIHQAMEARISAADGDSGAGDSGAGDSGVEDGGVEDGGAEDGG
ncbi:hypothetical protein H4R18_004438, partial [Coemansia javaensis]